MGNVKKTKYIFFMSQKKKKSGINLIFFLHRN